MLPAVPAAAFMAALALGEAGDHLAAAAAFDDFVASYPAHEAAADALFNAGYFLERAGDAEAANQRYEHYIRRFPLRENTPTLRFRLAGRYTDSLDLELAVQHYDRLYLDFPDNQDAPDALFNASWIRAALSDPEGAALGFERYSSWNRPDAEQVHWLAGAQWEKVGEAEALAFYRRHLKCYPDQSPDHMLAARRRLAELDAPPDEPAEAAPGKPELRGQPDATVIPVAGPAFIR